MCTRRLVRHGVEVSTSVVFSFLFFFSPPSHLSLLSVSASLLQRHPLHSWCQFRLGPPVRSTPAPRSPRRHESVALGCMRRKSFLCALARIGCSGLGRRLWIRLWGWLRFLLCRKCHTSHTSPGKAHPFETPQHLVDCEAEIRTSRIPALWFPEGPRGQPDRNEYWLLGMNHSCNTGSKSSGRPTIMSSSWKLPSWPGTPTGDLPPTAKSGASVPQTGPGCRGRSISVISDWDAPVAGTHRDHRAHKAHPQPFLRSTRGSRGPPAKCQRCAAPPDQDQAGGLSTSPNLSHFLVSVSPSLDEDGFAPCPFHVSVPRILLTLCQTGCSALVEARDPPDRCIRCIDAISSRLADNFSAVKASFLLLTLLYCVSLSILNSARRMSWHEAVYLCNGEARVMTSWLAH